MTIDVLEPTAPSELTLAQWRRLVDSIDQQLANDEAYRLLVAISQADDFTLANYESWFREVAE